VTRGIPSVRSEDTTEAPSVVWARGDDRLVGYGEALRLTFSGADRMTEAAIAWRDVAAAATVHDPVGVTGTGLVAFGSFAFADSSSTTSVLIVPKTIVGRRGGVAFRTDVGTPERQVRTSASLGEPRALGEGRFSSAAYEAAVEDAVERIRSGTIEKVVLARDLTITTDAAMDLEPSLRVLRQRYREAWTFAIDGFFGASPETLIASDGVHVLARVLAGTAARGSASLADIAARNRLLESGKDRMEHALAVDSLLITLAPHVDELDPGRPFALQLPNVWHLATDVTARLSDGSTSLDLVAALHPTAAVAGVPRDVAIETIAELEPFDRGRYAGPVGWIDADGAGEWAIGLRSAQIESDTTIRAYAGAGIVAQSDPHGELTETGWKFLPVLEALGLDADDLATAASAAAAPRPGSDRARAR
jgi:menaquinone-specific isochorismate synthase